VSTKREQKQVQQVAEAVVGLLTEAVKETIEQRSPEPSRECVAELVAVDRRAAPEDNGGPVELMATLGLIRWAGLARRELGDGPEWIEQALGWIEQTLGKRYRARSAYTAGALRSEVEAAEIMMYSEALRADFLPSLIWLIAATVALHGAGDVDWLRDLERSQPTGP
jgi:hypothetical protein